MRLSDFAIGMEFMVRYYGDTAKRWRVTDLGRYNVIAICVCTCETTRIDREGHETKEIFNSLVAEQRNYFDGPPYGVLQHVFDEYDLPGCMPVYEYLFSEEED